VWPYTSFFTSPEMRERDMLGGDERQQFNRLVAARKREQDIKVCAAVEIFSV
jgi:hypothetical protein